MLDATSWVRRSPSSKNLVLFAHGFNGSAVDTWVNFPKLIESDPDLISYECCFWGYPAKIDPANFLKRLVWSDNPDLDTVGRGLRTFLDETSKNYGKIVLVAHSMGGLVLQLFLLGEIRRGCRDHLDRITEVVLYGTPSAGLIKASLVALLDTQAADMAWYGSLIRDIRYYWTKLVDAKKATDPQPFRLTLVAGMQDRFVPQETALDPFPFDEKSIVPGNHVEMVKPTSTDDLAYVLLKNRMLRAKPTVTERRTVMGQSPDVVQALGLVKAAAELGDVDDLKNHAKKLLGKDPAMPLVERALGLALLDYEAYEDSTALLDRYVNFGLDGLRPFEGDAQAHQQLAIARSGTGDIVGAVASLEKLDEKLRNAPETLGILAGRFKRQWLKTGSNIRVARQALNLYLEALDIAQRTADAEQQYYNGVNAAYLQFASHDPQYEDSARKALAVAREAKPGYWSIATVGECLLLLRDYLGAANAYEEAQRWGPPPRHWNSTGQQANDILKRQGSPPAGSPIQRLFS